MPVAKRYPLSADLRLHGTSAFDRVFKLGSRAGAADCQIVAIPNDLGHARLGVSVPKRFGCSPARNRIRRLIREAFRLTRPDLPPMDFVFVPKPGLATTVDDLRQRLTRAAETLARRLAAKNSSDASSPRTVAPTEPCKQHSENPSADPHDRGPRP